MNDMIGKIIVSTSTKLVASLIYDAYKNVFRGFNQILEKAFTETHVYFSNREENPIELNVERFKKVLIGKELLEEIEFFKLGEKEIDEDRLALNFANISGFYLEDESQFLSISKEIVHYFLCKLDSLLLENSKFSSQMLKSYIQIASNKHLEYDKIIITKLDDITEKLDTLPDKKFFDDQFRKIHQSLTSDTNQHKGYYKDEFDRIKQLIKEKKFTSAKNEADNLRARIEKSEDKNREDLFLINSYLADISLQSNYNQKDAIQYFNETILYCDDEERKSRHKSWLHLLNNNYEAALTEIEKTISINPSKIENIQVKLNILIALNNYDEAKKTCSVLPDDVQGLYLKAWIAFRAGTYKESREYIEQIFIIEPENLEAIILYCDCIIIQTREVLSHDKQMDDDTFLDIKKAEQLINESVNKIDVEQYEKKSYLLYHKGIVSLWLKKYSISIQAFEESIKLNRQNEYVFRNLGFAYLFVNDSSNALRVFRELKLINNNHQDIDKLILDSLLLNGETEAVINEISELKKNNPDYDIRYDLTLIEAYKNSLQTSKAEKLLGELENKYGLTAQVILARVQFLIPHNQEYIVNLLETNLELLQKSDLIYYAYNILAACYYEIRSFIKAIFIYKKIVNINVIDNNLKRLISALYQLKRFNECIEICKTIKKNYGFQSFFTEYEANIYLHTANFKKAADIYKQLVSQNNTRIDFIINYGYCLYRLGIEDKALEAFKQCESKKDINTDELILLSKTYNSTGYYEKAVHFAYEAVARNPLHYNANTNFIFTVLMNSNKSIQLDEKYPLQFQKCLKTLEEHYGGSTSFQVKKYNIEDGSFVEDIKNLLKQSANFCQNAETVYLEKRLPIAFLSKMLNRNIIEVWEKVTVFPQLTVFYSDGVLESREKDLNSIINSKDIIIDIVALLTLDSLSMIEKLTDVFSNIYITQSTIDILLSMKGQYEMSAKTTGSTMWYENGNIFNLELNPEYYEEKIKKINSIIERIHPNPCFHIIGKELIEENKFSEQQLEHLQIIKDFDENIYDNIIACTTKGLSYYADDWMLRYFSTEFNILSFGCQSFLIELNNKKILSYNEYNSSLIKLISMNYHFISITAETLILSVEKNSFIPNTMSLIPFNVLKHNDNDLIQLIAITIPFLKWLWRNAVISDIKFKWFNIILESITFNRDRQRIINTIFQSNNQFISVLMPHHKNEFIQFMNIWKKTHCLV